MDMNEVVNGSKDPKDEIPAEVVEAEALPVTEVEEGAPSAQTAESHVPLAALEAERKQRKDHKERADRAEERLRVYEEQQRQPNGQPQAQVDPVMNLKLDLSEEMLRSQLKDATDIDEKIATFAKMAKSDPSLAAAMFQSRHPWKFAYDKVKQIEAMQEIGDDPATYRARLRTELEAEIRASLETTSAPVIKVPASLNGVRSSAQRGSPGFTGPTPLDVIVNSR